VDGLVPDRSSIARLIGAVCMEQTDEWTEHAATWASRCLTSVDQAVADAPSTDGTSSLELPETAMARIHSDRSMVASSTSVDVTNGLSTRIQPSCPPDGWPQD
jgi:hypothetical protein